MRCKTRIAEGARTPNTIEALRKTRAHEEQLELEDFIASLGIGHTERVML
jgi:hypothetical protein